MIIGSFVHGYHNLKKNNSFELRPALFSIKNNKKKIYSYNFYRNQNEFSNINNFYGEKPFKSSRNFKVLPRYGFMGISLLKNDLYCAAYNAIYVIDSNNFNLKKIISNHLMCNLHSILVTKKYIIYTLNVLDMIIFSDLDGKIIKTLSINPDLKIIKNKKIPKRDWRFFLKQKKGSEGYFHFNNLTYKSNKIFVTSRNINSLIEINLEKNIAKLRTMNFKSPCLIHDGFNHNGVFYFTSINGKIIEAIELKNKIKKNRLIKSAKVNFDFETKITDIDNNIIKGKTNWCRGLSVSKNKIYVGIDGRYDKKLNFSILELSLKNFKLIKRYIFDFKKIKKKVIH